MATVRHYLREGLLPEPVKTSKNMAYYPPEFADRIRLIKQLQEDRFMPLRVIRDVLESAGDEVERLRDVVEAGDSLVDRVLAPLAERTPEAEILERYEIPERALRRLTEVGVLSPDEHGYSQAEVRVIDAISRFRAAGWNETTGFGARDVARLMNGLAPVDRRRARAAARALRRARPRSRSRPARRRRQPVPGPDRRSATPRRSPTSSSASGPVASAVRSRRVERVGRRRALGPLRRPARARW